MMTVERRNVRFTTGPEKRLGTTVATVMVLLMVLTGVTNAGRERVPASNPSVWSQAAVNAVILQYTYTGKDSHYLSETAERLSLLIHRSVLYSIIKYNSVGATQIVMEGSKEDMQPETIFKQILDLEPGARSVVEQGRALVFLWGHLYEEGDNIYIQSYIRFLRRGITETVTLPLASQSGQPLELVGHLPLQAFAFAPRRLTVQVLDKINAEFERNAVVRERPNVNARGYPIDPDKLGSYAYRVLEAHGEWMKIEPMGAGSVGWIRTGVSFGEADLRSYMPELHFVEAAAGYLRYQMSLEADMFHPKVRPEWVQRALGRYERGGLPIGRAKVPTAVAKVMSANITILGKRLPSAEGVTEASRLYAEAADLIPYNADARNLSICAQIYLGHLDDWTEEAPKKLASDLLHALSIDPGNARVLANLESFYSLLASHPDSERLLPAEELASRLEAVKQVRAAMSTEK